MDLVLSVSSPKNENSVINYSPSFHSKPIRHSFIFRTQIKMFLWNLKHLSVPPLTATLRKKGTKAVTGAVPFQKTSVRFNMYILGGNMYILGANMYILGANMYILGANK